MLEGVGKYIDSVIYKAILDILNPTLTFADDRLSEEILEALVIEPIKNYLFEGFNEQMKETFFSRNTTFTMCTKIFYFGDNQFNCLECQSFETSVMCKDCFLNSIHVTHKYRTMITLISGQFCDCGDQVVCKYHKACTIHHIPALNEPLKEDFINRLDLIVKYICRFLEKIATNDFSLLNAEYCRMQLSYNDMRNCENFDLNDDNGITDQIIDECDDDQNMCLLVFNDEWHGHRDVIRSFQIYRPMINLDEINLMFDVNITGYACVLFKNSLEECRLIKYLIKKFRFKTLYWIPILCKIIPVKILYFIRLSRSLINFIHEICSTKSQLCDILCHIVFKETSFANVYIMNESHLWMEFKYSIINKVFLLVLFSDYGKKYIIELYLQKLDHIYQSFMVDGHRAPFCFMDLTFKFFTSSSLTTYLVENGFLMKMINFLTIALTDINICKGAKLSDVPREISLIQKKIKQIMKLFQMILDCLLVIFPVKKWSDKFRSEVVLYSIRLIEFSYCFDDLEPLKKFHDNREPEAHYKTSIYMVWHFYFLIKHSLTWFIKYPEIVSEMILKFLSETQKDISSVFNDRINYQVVEQLINYNNVENSEFSVFNISRRFYIDTLVLAIIEKNPEGIKQFEKVVKNDIMLVWLSLPSVTSISFYTNFLSCAWDRNSTHISLIINMYQSSENFNYLYMQDFTVVQILMAHMSPDRFLKYLIYNMIPKIREKVDITQSLSCILNFLDPEHETEFYGVMKLIYNAMSERHFVGKIEDYGHFLTQRRLIHYLGCADVTHENILNYLYFRRDLYWEYRNESNKYIDDALQQVANLQTSLNSDYKYSLKPSYFNQVNFYYFMYSAEQLSMIWDKIFDLYKHNKLSFEVPQIIELRNEFIGITNFIFSDEFFELILYSLAKLSSYSQLKDYIPTRDITISLMSLCFIFKSSKKQDAIFLHKERIDAIYATHAVLGGKNIIEFLEAVRAEINCPILCSIILYFIRLSNVTTNTTSNVISQNKTQARASRVKILKKLSQQREEFFRHDQDWSIFDDSIKNQMDNNQAQHRYKSNFFCEICRVSETTAWPTNFDIFQFSTDYICCAFTRWTRRLENIYPIHVNCNLYYASHLPILYNVLYTSTICEKSLPEMAISGCAHSFHVKCQPKAFYKSRNGFTRFEDISYYRCYMCKQTNNFFLPLNHPIICVTAGFGAVTCFIFLINKLISLHESDVLQESEISPGELLEKKLFQERLFQEKLLTTNYESNFYLKICSIFFYVGRNQGNILNISDYCECVISTMISSLKSSINNIEKYHRYMSNRPRIFNIAFVEGSNFKVSSHLSRLCYYACGLAPSLKQIGIPKDDISRLLTPLYFKRLEKFRNFLQTLDICEPQNKNLNEILNIDHFEIFSSTLITISAIINLNPKAKGIMEKHWEVSLVHMFYLLIVFNVFYYFHSRNDLSHTEISEEYDLENINSLWKIYATIFSLHTTPTINIQRNLYELYLFNTLPFIRKVSILFYQLFNWNAEFLTGNDSLDPSVELILLLRYLNIPENPSIAWTVYESNFLNCLKKYSSISNFNVSNMLTREQYLTNMFGLSPLPSNYLDLLIEHQNLRCLSCNRPAIKSIKCLICGQMLPIICECKGQSMEKVVSIHIIVCDGTFALFLEIDPPRLLFYRMCRRKYLNFSIYQDEYGGSMYNSHISLRLSEERYRRLDDLYQRDCLESVST